MLEQFLDLGTELLILAAGSVQVGRPRGGSLQLHGRFENPCYPVLLGTHSDTSGLLAAL
jgi:hypothetical protein